MCDFLYGRNKAYIYMLPNLKNKNKTKPVY